MKIRTSISEATSNLDFRLSYFQTISVFPFLKVTPFYSHEGTVAKMTANSFAFAETSLYLDGNLIGKDDN